MIYCTVSGNSTRSGEIQAPSFSFGGVVGTGGTGGNGGGVYSVGGLFLNSSTIVSNFAGAGGVGGVNPGFPGTNWNGGGGGDGGGIYQISNGSSVEIRNTLIALNAAGNGGVGGQSPGPITNNGIIFPGLPPDQIGAPGTQGLSPDVSGCLLPRDSI
jgi:hypothetical protein